MSSQITFNRDRNMVNVKSEAHIDYIHTAGHILQGKKLECRDTFFVLQVTSCINVENLTFRTLAFSHVPATVYNNKYISLPGLNTFVKDVH